MTGLQLGGVELHSSPPHDSIRTHGKRKDGVNPSHASPCCIRSLRQLVSQLDSDTIFYIFKDEPLGSPGKAAALQVNS